MASTPPDTPHPPMDEHDALPAGTRFGELEVLRVLGVGGFGIVYLAQDHALERLVALKEYMPSSLAGRGQGLMVSIRSGAHTETYALGLRSFVNEARLLARFNHPSLVKVYRFWEENGTAYMVMPYLQGSTLREVRRSMSAPPSETWMRSVIDPLLDALEQLHREDVFHRDIAPDNVLLPPGELPVLLDFGAARREIGDQTQTFTAILKPSYAPIEQYAEVVQLRQGPWTDLYALGAVVYYLLRGTPPPPATARAVQDDVPLLVPADHPDMSPSFIAAIEWALAIRPADRPQNIAALREVLEGRATAPQRSRGGATPPQRRPADDDTVGFAKTQQFERTAAEAGSEPTRPMTRPPRTEPAFPPAAGAPSPGSRLGMLMAGFAAFVALAAGAAWWAGGRALAAPEIAQSAPAPAAAATVAALPPATPVAAQEPGAASDKPAAASAARLLPPAGFTPVAKAPAARPIAKPEPEAAAVREEPATLERAHAPPLRTESAAPTPSPAHAREPQTPRQACGSRVFLALALCMEEQCELPRFKGHPQCRRVQELVERRRRGEGGD